MVVDSMPVGLYVIDRDYRIQAWNRKREAGMQGVSRGEAIGRKIFDILHRQPGELLRREFDEVLATGQMQQFHMESRASGELRTYRISKIPMRAHGEEVTHVITIGEDITEWKAALERSAQAEKLAAIGQLAAGVMHEINNPLATIAACAETMALGVDDPSGGVETPAGYGEYLKIIDHEVHRCKRIIDGLLDFSRPKPVERGPVDLNAVVKQTLFLLKHHTRFKRTTVNAELDASIGAEVTGDPDQLTQVIMALLLNAMDAIGTDGAITLRTVRDDTQPGMVRVEVQDEGHGIPREDLTKIFEPFYTTKAPGKGTGLGLSICYGIISDHGGRIEVDSTVGEGTTFRIVLPGRSGP
jgi:two-component system NtrC family sensor kinase